MYRLLIVDDERIVLESISYIIKNNFSEISFDTARSGREAIEKGEIFRPDIILMDIKMPGINGLDAIREIKKNQKDALFIIITAYEQFEFAKEALKLGVIDYLLKPMNKNTLIDIINRAIQIIEKERNKRKLQLENLERLERLLPFMEHNFIYSVILNKDLLNVVNEIGININPNDEGCIVNVNINKNDVGLYGEAIENFIRDYLRFKCNSITGPLIGTSICLFIYGLNNSEIKERLTALSAALISYFKDIKFTISVGSKKNIEELNKSYTEALSVVFEEEDILFFDDIKEEEGRICDINTTLNSQAKFLQKRHINKIILNAMKYIDNNYSSEIALEDIAREVAVTPNYFSRLFKEETGENYIEYLTKVRINKAKQLMENTNISIKEICYMIGYNDPNYFSRLFKKIEKISPTDYMNSIEIK